MTEVSLIGTQIKISAPGSGVTGTEDLANDTTELGKEFATYKKLSKIELDKLTQIVTDNQSFTTDFEEVFSRIPEGRPHVRLSFDYKPGFQDWLIFYDEDSDLETKEKVVKDGFLFGAGAFTTKTKNLFEEKEKEKDKKIAEAWKAFKGQIALGLSPSSHDSLGLEKDEQEDLIQYLKFQNYQSRKAIYLNESSKEEHKLSSLERYFLMEPIGHYDDYLYRLVDGKPENVTEFIEKKRKMTTGTPFLKAQLKIPDMDSASYNSIIDGIQEFDIRNLSKLNRLISNPKPNEAELNKLFPGSYPKNGTQAEKRNFLLSIEGSLSLRPSGATVMKESVARPARINDLGLNYIHQITSINELISFLDASQEMKDLAFPLKSNAKELLDKIIYGQGFDYADLIKLSQFFHAAGIDEISDRQSRALSLLNIANQKIEPKTLSSKIRMKLTEAGKARKIIQDKSLVSELNSFNLLEADQLISSLDQVFENDLIEDIANKIKEKARKDITNDEILNIIKILARSSPPPHLPPPSSKRLSIQDLKAASKAYRSDNPLNQPGLVIKGRRDLISNNINKLLRKATGASPRARQEKLKEILKENNASREAYALVPLLIGDQGESVLLRDYVANPQLDLDDISIAIYRETLANNNPAYSNLVHKERSRVLQAPFLDYVSKLSGDEFIQKVSELNNLDLPGILKILDPEVNDESIRIITEATNKSRNEPNSLRKICERMLLLKTSRYVNNLSKNNSTNISHSKIIENLEEHLRTQYHFELYQEQRGPLAFSPTAIEGGLRELVHISSQLD